MFAPELRRILRPQLILPNLQVGGARCPGMLPNLNVGEMRLRFIDRSLSVIEFLSMPKLACVLHLNYFQSEHETCLTSLKRVALSCCTNQNLSFLELSVESVWKRGKH